MTSRPESALSHSGILNQLTRFFCWSSLAWQVGNPVVLFVDADCNRLHHQFVTVVTWRGTEDV